MEKFIHRRISFTADDVKAGLTLYLKEHDHPVPSSPAAAKLKLTGAGAVLEWTEDSGAQAAGQQPVGETAALALQRNPGAQMPYKPMDAGKR
jgi:hypothetical protein